MKRVRALIWDLVTSSFYVSAWVVIGYAVLMRIPVVNLYVIVLAYAAVIYPWLTGVTLGAVVGLVALLRWMTYQDRRSRELVGGAPL